MVSIRWVIPLPVKSSLSGLLKIFSYSCNSATLSMRWRARLLNSTSFSFSIFPELIDFQNKSGQALPCLKAFNGSPGLSEGRRNSWPHSTLSLFRTSHGVREERKPELLLLASRALGHGLAPSRPSLRVPPLQRVPWGPPCHLGLCFGPLGGLGSGPGQACLP